MLIPKCGRGLSPQLESPILLLDRGSFKARTRALPLINCSKSKTNQIWTILAVTRTSGSVGKEDSVPQAGRWLGGTDDSTLCRSV